MSSSVLIKRWMRAAVCGSKGSGSCVRLEVAAAIAVRRVVEAVCRLKDNGSCVWLEG